MIKRVLPLLIIIGLGILYYFHFQKDVSESVIKLKTQRKFIQGPDKKEIQDIPPGIKFTNIPSKEWPKKLRKSFFNQAPNLRDAKIELEKSLVWVQDGNALMVESVRVTLIDDKNEESSFRALIDPQSGKILETWDRTISDPANPKDEFKLKLDPRY